MRVRADTVFYRIGKAAWIPFIAFGFWFAGYGYEEYGGYLACSLKRISGIPCPGCGGTRAFYYLFSGEIGKSFFHHPAVLYGVLVCFQKTYYEIIEHERNSDSLLCLWRRSGHTAAVVF